MIKFTWKSRNGYDEHFTKIIWWKPFNCHQNHFMKTIPISSQSWYESDDNNGYTIVPPEIPANSGGTASPSRLSLEESLGNPYQNSTGESRQGFTRDLRGSEGSPWGFRKEWMRVPGDFEGSGGESLGISKGVEGSPWGFWREWRGVPWELEGSKGKSLGI